MPIFWFELLGVWLACFLGTLVGNYCFDFMGLRPLKERVRHLEADVSELMDTYGDMADARDNGLYGDLYDDLPDDDNEPGEAEEAQL